MTDMLHEAHQADKLAPLSKMSHVAVKDGAWTNPNTWSTGTVPGAEANVHIPKDVTVTYDADTDMPLGTVRVDGMLDWATDQNTTMLVETIVSTHGSQIEVGSMHDTAVSADVTAKIVFRDTPIDTATDPEMLGHGLVAMGTVDIMGAEKQTHLTMSGNGVSAGSTSVKLDGDLTNWNTGDTILFVGTGSGSRDETRTIVSVNGNAVAFDKPLSYDHEPPAGFDFDTHVGNLSHNVIFTSENPDGVRGHVMLMNGMAHHGENANSAMFAEFADLGRTDQSIPTGTAGNPAGRYPLHLHQIGTDPDSPSSLIQGVAVSGSPGWGIVQHSSNAMINDSIIYDSVGAGMVSEWGDENGMWMRNLVTSVAGTGVDGRQAGVEGAAYENQSRAIVQQDNIAANSQIGWNWFGHEEFPEDADHSGAPREGEHRKMFERDQLPYDPNPFDSATDHEEGVISGFKGNTSIANNLGFHVFHRQTASDSDTLSVISDFDVWGGEDAVLLRNYAYHYEFIDSTWVGTDKGFEFWIKNSNVVLNNIDMHDFKYGFVSFGVNHETVLHEVDFHDVGTEFDLRFNQKYPEDQSWIDEYAELGIDHMNPMPKVLSKSDLGEFSGLELVLDDEASAVLSPSSRDITITGTIIDGLGERRFFEHMHSSEASLKFSKEGASLKLGNDSDLYFSVNDFLDVHGTFQNADGSWVSPVVFWLTERLEGKQHPVIIEFQLEGFENDDLLSFELDRYPNPTVDNLEWFKKNWISEYVTDDTTDSGSDGDTTDSGSDGDTTDSGSDGDTTDSGSDGDTTDSGSGGDTTDSGSDGDTTDSGSGGDTTDSGSGGDTTETDTTSDGTLPQSGLVWQDLDSVSFGDMGDRAQINQSDAEGRTHALAFETGSDVASTQVVYEQGGSVRGLNLVIENGTLYAGLWNKAEEDWGFKELSANVEANTRYSSVLVMDGQLPMDGTATLYLNGTAVDTVGGVGKLYEHSDDIGIGQVAQNTLVRDAVQNDALKFEGRIDKLAHYNIAVDGSDLQNLNAFFAYTDTDVPVGEPVREDTSANEEETVDTTTPVVSLEDAVIGSDEGEHLKGTAGVDVLIGLAGDDTLRSLDGDDVLVPGAGSDKLYGGSGADAFVFDLDSLDGNINDIKDFSLAEGDAIHLHDIFPDTVDAGNVDDHVRFTGRGTLSVLEVDITGHGDSFAELAIIRFGRGLTLEEMVGEDALMF